jgi:alpha-tubulin suppressor-like RCC1 family protein
MLCHVAAAAAAAAATRDRLVPAEVSGLAGRHVVAIAGGWRHTMALDSEGGVWAWGWNKFGQLGEWRAGVGEDGGTRGWWHSRPG